jgi:hypothetical protein
MGWENRSSRQYYYRKRRKGKQVVSEYVGGYVGGGFAGELSELLDREDKFKTDVERAELMQAKEDAAKLDRDISKAKGYTQAFTRAVLLLSGYHAPRRQWRKIRQ